MSEIDANEARDSRRGSRLHKTGISLSALIITKVNELVESMKQCTVKLKQCTVLHCV